MGWGRQGAGVVASAAALFLTMGCGVASAQSSAAPQSVDGVGEWRNGKGTCTGAANIQNGAPGLSNFDQPARVTVDGHHITVVFRRPSTGAYDSVPSEGDVARDGSFETTSNVAGFGTFTWKGTAESTNMVGVVTENTGGENGAPCTATWDLTIRLERVLPLSGDTVERSASSSPTASASAPPSATASSTTSSDHDSIDWLPIGAATVGLVAIGAGIAAWLKTRARDDPCDCACTVEVLGPDRLYLCDCADPTWQLRPLGNQDMSGGQTVETTGAEVLERHRVLEARVVEGSRCPRNRPDNIVFSRDYEAPVTPTCRNGGQVTNVKRAWSVDTSRFSAERDSRVVLNVTATVTVTCPKGSHTVQVEGQKIVAIRLEKCRVFLVINNAAPGFFEVGHCGVRISCGEFDRIYGFYPSERHGAFTVVPGAGEVRVASRDGVSQDYRTIDNYYAGQKKSVFEITVTCAQCCDVQDYWERLRADPGRYGLANNNCVKQGLKSVKALIPTPPSTLTTPSGAVEWLHEHSGLKETITP